MTLSEKDGQLFYKLWLPFLDYVNEKCKVNKKVKDMANAKSLDSMEATFIPFRDVIISDGLVMPYNIVIGKNMAKQFKDVYMSAKKSGTLIKSL